MTTEEREIRAIIDNARLSMSEANREHFDIEATDHLEHLKYNAHESGIIIESIRHRAYLHQMRNMFRVPPMLIKRDTETDEQHEAREMNTWGLYGVESIIGVETGNIQEKPQRINLNSLTINQQQELF